MKVLAVIPARGGSKSIPRKNLVDVAGRPLIAWVIGAAGEAKRLDRVIVSTEDEEIAETARRWGAECRAALYTVDTRGLSPESVRAEDNGGAPERVHDPGNSRPASPGAPHGGGKPVLPGRAHGRPHGEGVQRSRPQPRPRPGGPAGVLPHRLLRLRPSSTRRRGTPRSTSSRSPSAARDCACAPAAGSTACSTR